MVQTQLDLKKRLQMYWKMTDLGSLTRRYIVIGAFDGALTIVAIVLYALAGALAGGFVDVRKILVAGIGGCIGLAISSGWGAYEAERVERKREIEELEAQMHRSMDGCMVDRAVRFATYWASFIHGISPLPAGLLPLLPLIFFRFDFLFVAFISVSITMIFLFVLGIWMGRIAKSNTIIAGLRMVFAGLITAAILFLLPGY
jgi:predicted membrane protein (TIGR00267 family)